MHKLVLAFAAAVILFSACSSSTPDAPQPATTTAPSHLAPDPNDNDGVVSVGEFTLFSGMMTQQGNGVYTVAPWTIGAWQAVADSFCQNTVTAQDVVDRVTYFSDALDIPADALAPGVGIIMATTCRGHLDEILAAAA